MEKVISPEERMRRAEEIYYRRKLENNSVRMSSSQVRDGKEKRQISLYKKMVIQILFCILIYLVFSLIKDANYIFSEDILNKTKEFLSTDINFKVLSNQVSEFFKNNQDKLDFLSSWLKEDSQDQNEQNENRENEQSGENANQENSEGRNNEAENKENNQIEGNNENQNSQTNVNKEEGKNNTTTNSEAKNNSNTQTGMGGATSNEVTVATSANSSQKTQMEKDAEYIKDNFSFGLPIKGTITSRYGTREATEIVPANHQGIDIGVNVGTTVVAAMAGKVSLVSDEGEYGTHVKIENKDITTIYAHCSKILVKKGATIKKGQKIALSGNTGRTTGPHLHFEIRRDNRTVNPELVLKF